MKPLFATARLQFHKGFTLHDAERLVPYFEKLGISHLYASPLLTARAGSTHGYDIVNHNEINPELGGEEALQSLVGTLRGHGMGLILDIVPNHMGVGGHDNAWWLDVLEWGRQSPYAEYFDIDWDPPDVTMRGRILAPFLGTSYGEALESGNLKLKFDEAAGRLDVWYYDEHRFPIAPRDYAAVLLTEGGPLEEVARIFADPGPGSRAAQRRRIEQARGQLSDPLYRPAVTEALRAYRTDTPAGRDLPAPPPRAAELSPRVVACRDRRDQLAPLLRRERPRWRPARGARGVRGDPREDPQACMRMAGLTACAWTTWTASPSRATTAASSAAAWRPPMRSAPRSCAASGPCSGSRRSSTATSVCPPTG